jgi:type I restriction enzyme S subunit
MKREPLLSAAPFSGSRVRPYAGTRRYLSTGDLQDRTISFIEVTYSDKPSRADISVKPGDILFARMKGTKKVLEIDQVLADIIVSTGFAVIRPAEHFDGKFLAIYLKSDDFEKQKEKFCSGAIQPAITNAGIEEVTVPFPPLDDQKRIALLLGKVDGLIARRKLHLQQLDDLLKSAFLKMFGDPVRNENGWKTATIDHLCEEIIDCPHSTPDYSEVKTGYFCIRSGDIVDGYLDLGRTLHVEKMVYEERIKRHTPQVGDIVYSREGGRLGNAARILGGESFCLGQRIMLFKVGDESDADFLWALLESRSFKEKLKSLVGGGAAPRVNIKDLKNVSVIEPPIELRTKFSGIARRIDRLRSRYQSNLSGLEALFGAFSQMAFIGKLDLSRVPLPIEKPDLAKGKAFVEGEKSLEPSIELPAPADSDMLQSAKGRKTLLGRWLKIWLEHLGDKPLSAQTFMKIARQQFSELAEDESREWGVAEYDELKAWVFEALEGGRLTQSYDDANNRIKITTAKG